MSILIKGMEMPTDDNGKMEPTAVWVYPNGYAIVFKDNGNMQQYTQAIPVPDYGDLINRDACVDYARDNDHHAWEALAYAPTIIPADEEEDNVE